MTLTFEEAMGRLQALSEKIRSEETSLEEAIACYEEGASCYAFCEETLQNAEQKIITFSREEAS